MASTKCFRQVLFLLAVVSKTNAAEKFQFFKNLGSGETLTGTAHKQTTAVSSTHCLTSVY